MYVFIYLFTTKLTIDLFGNNDKIKVLKSKSS